MDERGIDTNSNKEDENILEEDNIEYFLMKTYDDDITLDRKVDVGNDLMYYLNQVPTTNSGKLSEVIDEETKNGRKFGKIRISGHVILNQFFTLLTRKKYEIKGSSISICFLQICCVIIRGLSIPLAYP